MSTTCADGGLSEPSPHLLDSLGLSRSSVIRVTGAGGLSVLLWLCRHGFDEVGYVRSDLPCSREAVDGVLVAERCDTARVAELLARGPRLRPGGVLALRCERACAAPIRRILASKGFEVQFGPGTSDHALCIATLGVQPARRAA
jgi:hypothetical protein